MAVSIEGLSFFLPLVSFFFVFVLVYALLAKSQILGGSKGVQIFISLFLAAFFILQVELVDFVQFSSAWFVVFLVCVFLILVLVGFTHGNLDVIVKAKWLVWVLVGGLIGFFILSSAFVFNWGVNWAKVWDWFYTDWFGLFCFW